MLNRHATHIVYTLVSCSTLHVHIKSAMKLQGECFYNFEKSSVILDSFVITATQRYVLKRGSSSKGYQKNFVCSVDQ